MTAQIGLKNDLTKLQAILGSRLYSDKYSFISEVLQNATDSHRRAKNTDTLFTIGLKYVDYKYYFYVRDYGVSFESKEEFVRLACTLLESSKTQEKTNIEDQEIGKYGIGKIATAAFNKEWGYKVYYNNKGFDSKVFEVEGKGVFHEETEYYDTDEKNGVHYEVEIKSYELQSFFSNLLLKMRYFDGYYFDVDPTITRVLNVAPLYSIEFNKNFSIFTNPIFKYSTLSYYSDKMEICLDQYRYPINWDLLGINPIKIPVALNFSLDDFDVNPTREVITITTDYKEKVLGKILEFANYCMDVYNKEHPEKEYEDSLEYCLEVTNRRIKKVSLIKDETKNINLIIDLNELLDNLEDHESKLKTFKDCTLKGFLKEHSEMFFEKGLEGYNFSKLFNVSSMYKENRNISKNIDFQFQYQNFYHLIRQKLHNSPIIYKYNDKIPKLTLKYLKSKPLIFFLTKDFPTNETEFNCLKDEQQNFYLKFIKSNAYKYKQAVNDSDEEFFTLLKYLLNFFNKFSEDILADPLSVVVPEDFKEEKKVSKKAVVSKEEVILRLNVGLKPNSWSPSVYSTFTKNLSLQLNELYKEPIMTVYGTEDKIKKLIAIESLGCYNSKNKIRTAVIAERYQKRINTLKLHNFMDVDEFLKKHISFRRLATAYLVKTNLLQRYKDIFSHKEIIKNYISEEFASKLLLLEDYVQDYDYQSTFKTHLSSEVFESIQEVAKDFNLFDQKIVDEYTYVLKHIEKFAYVNILYKTINTSYKDKNHELTVQIIQDIAKYRKIKMSLEHYKTKEQTDEKIVEKTTE